MPQPDLGPHVETLRGGDCRLELMAGGWSIPTTNRHLTREAVPGRHTNREHAAVDVQRVNRRLGVSPSVGGPSTVRHGAIPFPKGELGERRVAVENRMADRFPAGPVDE